MTTKINLLYVGVLILFLYACADILGHDESTGPTARDIAVAYTDLEAVIDRIDELSQSKAITGRTPLINAEDKRRMGVDVRQAKKLIDTARLQNKNDERIGDELGEANVIIDDLNLELAPLAAERKYYR